MGCHNRDVDERYAQTIGTLVTVVGLIVLAPAATGRLIARTALGPVIFLSRWVRVWRPKHAEAIGAFSGSIRFTGRAHGHAPWVKRQSLDACIDELRRAVDGLRGQVQQIDARLGAEVRVLQVALRESEARLQQALTDHRATIRLQEQQSQELELEALPLAAAGALIAGCPFWFDESAWGTVAVVLVGLYAISRAEQSVGKIRLGLRDGASELGY